jgi:hypothetical protein
MTYSGNRVLNANNLALVLFLVGAVTIVCTIDMDTKSVILLLLFVLLIFWVISREAFYFELIDNELIIKNYLLPFSDTCYQLSNLKEIGIIELADKKIWNAALRITDLNDEVKCFTCSCLTKNIWKMFIKDIKDRHNNVVVDVPGIADLSAH